MMAVKRIHTVLELGRRWRPEASVVWQEGTMFASLHCPLHYPWLGHCFLFRGRQPPFVYAQHRPRGCRPSGLEICGSPPKSYGGNADR